MRKDALAVTVSTLVMGVFGAFLRWLQNRTIYEEETGLAVRGAAMSTVYVIYSVLAVAAIIGLTLFWLIRYEKPRTAAEALHVNTILPAALSWVSCAVFALCGVALMFSTGGASYPRVQRVFGACVILGGACFPFLISRTEGETRPLGRLAGAVSALFFCFWLVFSYVNNAQDPVLWAYGPEILALAANTMAFYYMAALFYGGARPNVAIAVTQLAVFLDVCTLPDSRKTSLTAMLVLTIAMLLMLEFVQINNMKRKDEE